jgi:hypothetical protein
MDGKMIAGVGLLAVPAALIGVAIVWAHSNPVAIFSCITLMLIGGLYLLTYRDAFG